MSFTITPIESAPVINAPTIPNQFDLPSKEFVGYDPKGTTTVTGSPIERPSTENAKQENIAKETSPAESAKPEESVTLSPKISALARKEQAQRQRERALVQREKALEAKLQDAEKYQQLKGKIANKDFSAAEELGMTYEQYVQYQTDKIAGQDPNEQRVRQVETKLEELKKAQEELTTQEWKANQALWKQEIARVVDASEEFSTVKELNAHAAVLRHINDSFDEDGIELSAEEAAKEVEEHLLARAEKLGAVSKVRKKLEAGGSKVLGPPKNTPKTITQNMTVTSEKSKSKPFHLLSEMEQWEEAKRRVMAQRQQR